MENITLSRKVFVCENLSSLKQELNKRNIRIAETAVIGDGVRIGNGALISDYVIGKGEKIRNGALIGTKI